MKNYKKGAGLRALRSQRVCAPSASDEKLPAVSHVLCVRIGVNNKAQAQLRTQGSAIHA